MNSRVTIKDIANDLQISTTTVSKALNGHSKISQNTRNLVLKKADELGYKPNQIARAMAIGECRIGIVFFRHPEEYARQIEYGCYKAAAELSDYHVSIVPKFAPEIVSEALIDKALNDLINEHVDGIILSGASNHSHMYDNTLKKLDALGIPLLIKTGKLNIATSIGQINMDADVAGRLAAQFLSIALGKDAPVLLLVGIGDVSHTDRSADSFIKSAQQFGLSIIGVHSTNDDEYIAYYLVKKALTEHPELKGIYVNHFNSVSVCQCLEELGRTDIVVIGHDLFPDLAKKLEAGTLDATIFSNPCEIGRRAVMHMVNYILGIEKNEKRFIEMVPPVLVLKSNLSSYKDYLKEISGPWPFDISLDNNT